MRFHRLSGWHEDGKGEVIRSPALARSRTLRAVQQREIGGWASTYAGGDAGELQPVDDALLPLGVRCVFWHAAPLVRVLRVVDSRSSVPGSL